jgi:hypothetical protein
VAKLCDDRDKVQHALAALESRHDDLSATVAQRESASPPLPLATGAGISPARSYAHVTASQPATAAITTNVNDLIHEINLRNDKRRNVIIHGLQQSGTSDMDIAKKLFMEELHYNGAPIVDCKRIGKSGGTKPQLLLVTMASDDDVTTIMRSARSLRTSTDAYVAANIFVNRDLTANQRKEQFDLRTELRQRLASGESDLIIRNGTILKRSPAACAATHP